MFYGHHAGRFQGNGAWGVVGWILPLLAFGLLVALVIFAVTRLTSHHGPWPHTVGPVGPGPRLGSPDAAMEQVRYRYARGEMSREEYFRLMGDLGWGGPGPGGPPGWGPPPPAPAAGPGAAPPPSAPEPPPPVS